MRNIPSTIPAPDSKRSTMLAMVRRLRSGGEPSTEAAMAGIEREGLQAFTDGLPLSACPYVRTQEVDTWRGGWLNELGRQEVLAAISAYRS